MIDSSLSCELYFLAVMSEILGSESSQICITAKIKPFVWFKFSKVHPTKGGRPLPSPPRKTTSL